MSEHFKSTLFCPYGRFLNETANPLIKDRKYGGWAGIFRKVLPKSHRNDKVGLYWKNRFRSYKRVLVI